jgi:putative endonuclease
MQSTLSIGSGAEDLASSFLRSQGYFIVERNFRCRAGELDVVAYRADPADVDSPDPVIARHARMLIFVEVRARSDQEHGDALLAIGPAKQRQVVKIAAAYLGARFPDYEEIRFDVVGITDGRPVLIEDAFRG